MTIVPRYCILILLASVPLAFAEEPDPGALLAKHAETLLASIEVTDYQHLTEIDEAAGSIRCDCSGLVGYMLRHDYPWAYLSLKGKEAAWRTRPLSVTYYETFTHSKETGPNRWLRIRKMADARPGDILAWRKDEVVQGTSSGHTLMIASDPVLESDGRLRVRVIDSTRKIHAEDTRREGTTGVGAGTMWFVINEAGEPVRFYVDGGDRPGTSTKIAIGRLNPSFNPAVLSDSVSKEDADFLGLTPRRAGALAEKRDLEWRIVTERGKTAPVTLTIRKTRLNFAVEGGVVTRVARG